MGRVSKKAWIGGQIYSISGEGFNPEGKVTVVDLLDSTEGTVISPDSVSLLDTPTLCMTHLPS